VFDLEESAARGGSACDEVGSEFLWSSWHGEEGPGLKPLFKADLIRGAKAPRLIPKSEATTTATATAKASLRDDKQEGRKRQRRTPRKSRGYCLGF